jgi:aminoglycoside phosphotransferase (APT) family kinase protein
VSPPEIDADLVARLIAGQFPRWADLPVVPLEPGGWDNRTFRLGDTMSVRLPSAARYASQPAKEFEWLPKLAPHLPRPVPEPLALGEPGLGYAWQWTVCRWLEGEPATPGNIADPVAFANDAAAFLIALQAVDATGAPPPGDHNFHRGGDLTVYDAQTRQALAGLGDTIDTAAASEVWQAALASRSTLVPVWVHGDFAWGNLLVKDGKLCAVIDFGSCATGDPACDLTLAWTLLDGEARAAFRAALPTDADTWARARGWALWKALIVMAGVSNANPGDPVQPDDVVAAVIDDHRRFA